MSRPKPKSNPKPDLLPKVEWAIAGGITLVMVIFHVVLLSHAGGLWRDEINTLVLASMPKIGDTWAHLQYDSFPMLWFLVLRGWLSIAQGDQWLRVLGCLIGLGILSLLWLNARRLKYSMPLVSLALLAISATTLRVGDSLRAYGFGVVLFLVTFYFIWRIVETPSRFNVIAGLIVAVLSVHTLYYNAVLLLAVCSGGIAVALRNRWRNRAAILLGIGIVAAISILPYMGTIKGASDWNMLVRMREYSLPFFAEKCREAIGKVAVWFWAVLIVAGVIAGVTTQRRANVFGLGSREKNLGLFALVGLSVGLAAYFCFLKALRYQTQVWYYFALMALVATTLDILFTLSASVRTWRIARIVVVIALIAINLPATWRQARTRFTNVDLIAAELETKADPNDFILLNPWYTGISFYHYYRGSTPWTTLPAIQFLQYHRYDLIKEKMTLPNQVDAVAPVFEEIARTLKSGHRVWLAGGVDFLRPGERPVVLPPAPQSQFGWAEGPYHTCWSLLTGEFLERFARELQDASVHTNLIVNFQERLPLFVVRGWREGEAAPESK